MLARLRLLLFNTPVLVALGLFIAYLLFGWFGFGPVAQWGAEKYVADRTGHTLSLDEPEFDPFRLRVTVRNLRLSEPDGKALAGFKELYVDFETSSLFRWAWIFDTIRLTGPEGRLALLPEGKLNWTAFLDAFQDEEDEPDTGLPRLLIRNFDLRQARLDLADETMEPAFKVVLAPLELTLDELSTLPDDKGSYAVSARTALGGQLRWNGDVELKPVSMTGTFSLDDIQLAQVAPYLEGHLNIAAPEGKAGLRTDYRLGYDKKVFSLTLDRIGATVEGLRLRGAATTEPALALDKLAISGGRFDLDQRRLSVAAVDLAGGRVNLTRRADGSLDLRDWFPPAAPAPSPAKPPSGQAKPAKPVKPVKAEAAGQPWQFDLARFSLDGVGVRVHDQTFVQPLAFEVDNIKLDFKADARVGAGPLQAQLAEGSVQIGPIAVASAGKPLLTLDGVVMEGFRASLAERHAEIARLVLDGARLDATRAADGRIPLIDTFKPVGKAAPASASDAPAGPGWTWHLARAELTGAQVALRDETLRPAVGLDLDAIDASMTDLSQDLAASVPVKLALRVRQGGALQLQGRLVPAKRALDARVNLSGLSLTPAQPYIGQAANVVLVSGKGASQGRLRVAGERISYRGGFSVSDLLVNESATGNRLLAWKRLATAELAASPKAVDIGEVKVDGLGLKLVIHKDKTLNLKRLLKAQPAAPGAAGPRRPGKTAPDRADMGFTVERVTVSANEMDFADESLALPFGARIHGLKGTITGIGLDKGQPAQLELDGLVDDYGLARAVGQIDMLDPAAFTDIKVIFRNVEMSRLTPYSATFAGRRIDSGKLSLDLEYKVKARQLAGDNQIIMDKLILGERVESPTARNLPLDLAIAILQDSNGVIELGLPVSGSLDDPQFSYGAIVWKAIVNVIGKIVTAPFRALGKLFGISPEKMEKVSFDAGEAALLAPEREKLKQLAEALAKRPRLALTATPVWHPAGDREAIKDARLRRALAEAMGRQLAPDEDPGPVSIAQPKAREGLEKLYAARFGAPALESLKAKHAQANPEPPPTTAAGKLLSRLAGLVKARQEPLTEAEAARLTGADLHELIHQALLDRESVTDEQLIALARERGEAIRRELLADGVAPEKLTVQAPEQAGGEGRDIAVKLGLAVARKPAPAGPVSTPEEAPAATPAAAP